MQDGQQTPIRGDIQVSSEAAPPTERFPVMRGLRSSNHLLSSFLVRPDGVSVELQEEDEHILLLVREHFITNTSWILFALFLAVLPILFTLMPFWQVMPLPFQMVGSFMWYLLVAAVVFEGFLSWYFDVFVVTDKRVIDIDFNNLIYKNISSAEISRIQDVTYNVGGPLASFLDFGEVLVQTAGESQMIEIPNTPHPAQVAKLIDEMVLQDDTRRRV